LRDADLASHIEHVGVECGRQVDRLLFIVGVAAIIIDGAVPGWLGWGVVAREVLVAAMMLVGTALGMQRFPVSQWGKNYTFALMFAFPLLLLGASDAGWALGARNAGWAIAVPGVVLCYTTAIGYVPRVWRGVRAARSGAARSGAARDVSDVA
ncbi:MAG: hypothetical protein EBW96_04950, partial [Actinobacteria bacterium]|nr:hypothetical protein [Actinomycetota bacterium]